MSTESAKNANENLRREARVAARLRVSIVRGKTSTRLETSDVSFKGLFLKTNETLALRSLVRLRVSLPLREIEAHAMVVHVGEAGVGLQFWGLAGPDRIAWDDFVRELIQARRASAKRRAAKIAELIPPSDDD